MRSLPGRPPTHLTINRSLAVRSTRDLIDSHRLEHAVTKERLVFEDAAVVRLAMVVGAVAEKISRLVAAKGFAGVHTFIQQCPEERFVREKDYRKMICLILVNCVP